MGSYFCKVHYVLRGAVLAGVSVSVSFSETLFSCLGSELTLCLVCTEKYYNALNTCVIYIRLLFMNCKETQISSRHECLIS